MNQAQVRFGKGKVSQTIQVGTHQMESDIDAADGGDGLGPSPHDYLAAALASCTGMTLRMYATHKKWPLSDAVVTVTMDASTGAEKISRFDRSIKLIGELSEEQRQRLLAVSESCPVHKTLLGKVLIESRLV